MRCTLLTLTLLLTFAFPAYADDGSPHCRTGMITWDSPGVSPMWHPTGPGNGDDLTIVGTFLWASWEPHPVDEYDGVVSAEIPDGAVGASVCDDATVTFTMPPDGDPDPVEAILVDLVDLWGFDPTVRLLTRSF